MNQLRLRHQRTNKSRREPSRPLFAWLLSVAAIALIALLVPLHAAQQKQTSSPSSPDSRPRRTAPAKPGEQQTARQTSQPKPTLAVPLPKILINAGEPPPVPVDLTKADNKEIDNGATIKVDTSLVNLNVRVIDRMNRPVDNVREDEFHVFENGVPQPISYVSRQEVPISYGLVIDNSGSLRSQIDKVIETGKSIVNSNKPDDETFLVRFIDRDNIETKQDFTSNKAALIDALDGLYVQGGQTAVKDAVYLSAEHVAEYKKGDALDDRRRRALILVTDGEDRASFYNEEQLFARLREDDVQIFVIGFVKELDKESGLIRKSPRDKAVGLLERLAKETGGRVFFPDSLSELPNIASEITRDMRTQYRIGYSPTNKARDGSYRMVRVAIADAAGHDKRIAVTRPGYTAQREGSNPTAARTTGASTNGSTNNRKN